MRKELPIICFLIHSLSLGFGQKSDHENLILKYTDEDHTANINYHDGQMRLAVGTHNYQILRANRTHPEWADRMGWTYNHAPMLAYWNGHFLCHYLSTPMGEHNPPGVTLMSRSKDGISWEIPEVIFPVYSTAKPGGKYSEVKNQFMHQRMGFYVTPNGRLLVMGYYGGNNGDGIGRVVREVYNDFSFGPIYFIRVNDNWKGEVKYPFYHESHDRGFIEACDAFRSDRIRRIQWWEEDYLASDADTFYMPHERGKAFCFYTVSDALTVGLFKSRLMTYTMDGGNSWEKPFRAESLTYSGAKIWGQKLDNGQFALVYNPTDASERHPLCVAVSNDGLNFSNLAVVHGEVPVKRYWGIEKRPGPQYVRGIVEGNGDPPGNDLWVVYSVSKEDIWISRVPVPIKRTVKGLVDDDFSRMETGSTVKDWNVYSPKWCPVRIVEFPSKENKSLKLQDTDPYDYARATRVFGPLSSQKISFEIYVSSVLENISIDICDKKGNRLIQTGVDKNVFMHTTDISGNVKELKKLAREEWITIAFEINSEKSHYDLFINDNLVAKDYNFTQEGLAERIVFQTGKYRLERKIQEYKSGDQAVPGWDEPAADEPVEETVMYIRKFKTEIL